MESMARKERNIVRELRGREKGTYYTYVQTMAVERR